MKEEMEKRINEAEALSESLLETSDKEFKREDGELDIDIATERVAEGSRVIGELVEAVRTLDAEAEEVRKELEELKPKSEAAQELVRSAQNETRRLLGVVATTRNDEDSKAKLEDFNKRVEEGSIEVSEVLELQKAARVEYYDMFPPAVVTRAFNPDACPECGTERADGIEECKECGLKFETEESEESKADKKESAERSLNIDSFKVK